MRCAGSYGGGIKNHAESLLEGAIEMIANFEYTFSQHDETIRRAERNARLIAALAPERTERSGDRPQGRLTTLLRRIAGTAATA